VLTRQLPENVSNAKCQMVLQKFDPQAKDWQMGHTKVLLTNHLPDDMDCT